MKTINFDFLFHVSCDAWWVSLTTVVLYGSIRISFPFNKIDFDAKYVVGAEHKNTNTATVQNIDWPVFDLTEIGYSHIKMVNVNLPQHLFGINTA